MHTTDRMASGFHTVERLGFKQSMTPEGFLLCEGVPIARTGEMLYGPDEVPVEAGTDGIARVDRTAEEVFRPETIASYQGKPVTMDHPDDFVTPETWRTLSVGTTQNVRRGEGIDDEYLLADLLITHHEAIDAVRAGLREVSCGYDADYEQLEPGRGVQRNIIGNHVALVERGRCGPRCAIGDKEPEMAKKTWMDKLRAAFKTKDEAAMEEALKEAETSDADEDDKDKDDDKGKSKTGDAVTLDMVMAAIQGMGKRLDVLEKGPTKTKDADGDNDEDDDEDDDGETTDDILDAETAQHQPDAAGKTYTGDMAMVRSRAEILAPGVKLPTFDSKKVKAKDAICACQRRALTAAFDTKDGQDVIKPFLGSREPTFDKMPAATVDSIFTSAAELARHRNNQRGTRDGITTKDFGRTSTVASINEQNRKFYDSRKGV